MKLVLCKISVAHHESAVVWRDGEVGQAGDGIAALHAGAAPLGGKLELSRGPRGVHHAGDLHARAHSHHLRGSYAHDRTCLALEKKLCESFEFKVLSDKITSAVYK